MRVDFDHAALSAADFSVREPEAAVLKFGSSVLQTRDDLWSVVTEIYRHRRDGRKVVAIVSAFAGETDALIAEAAAAGANARSRHAPRLIALGEERSAALLAIACEAVGLDARILGARALSLRAGGPIDDAHPTSADANLIREEISRRDVVIVPGFVALGESGEPVLLGRGGSDLTAVFLASELGLSETTLVKDVNGVYDRDPAESGEALLYRRLDWRAARDVAGKLLQPKAIDFAAARNVGIRVLRLNGDDGTLVGARAEAPLKPTPPRKLRVAVAGLGLVGEGVALRIAAPNPDYELCAALVRDAGKKRHESLRNVAPTCKRSALLASRPDVIIDALPCGAAGRALIDAALAQGISVVTANKQAIAGSLASLSARASTTGASFLYSAAVGGGAPFIETAARARAAGSISSLEAVLNGTVNFVLALLAEGAPFDEAVKRAQAAGLAEPDPSKDLSGADARAKLKILGYVAFGRETSLDTIEAEALDADKAAAITREGGCWKQIARLERGADGTLAARISFERRDNDALFAEAKFEANALRIRIAGGGVIECKGKGAGRRPTVESILGDLGEVRRAERQRLPSPSGRRWREAPDEGFALQLNARNPHPGLLRKPDLSQGER